jgi:hypothetical protein
MPSRRPQKPRPYPTRFTVPSVNHDGMCWARPCMNAGENKGSFTQGRGYTSYYKDPIPCCMTNHLHGCPYPIPEPDPEVARCCYAPTYEGRGKEMTCQMCGSKAPRKAAKLLNELPRHEGVPCKHENRTTNLIVIRGWCRCPDCGGYWDRPVHDVQAFDVPTKTDEDHLDELARRLRKLKEAD